MNFPCNFSIKVMGLKSAPLQASIEPILTKHLANLNTVKYSTRNSNNDKYQALTIDFVTESQLQLDNIYQEVSHHPDVIMVL